MSVLAVEKEVNPRFDDFLLIGPQSFNSLLAVMVAVKAIMWP